MADTRRNKPGALTAERRAPHAASGHDCRRRGGGPGSSRNIRALEEKDHIKLMKEGQVHVDKISARPKSVIQCEPGSWKVIDAL
jgi:hypothetical protein